MNAVRFLGFARNDHSGLFMRNTRRVRGNLMKKAGSPRLARDDAGLSLDSGFWQFPIQMKHG